MTTVALLLLLTPVQTPAGPALMAQPVAACPQASVVLREPAHCVAAEAVAVGNGAGAFPVAEGAKDPRKALLYSIGGTAAILIPGVNVVAFVVGPAAGHIYADNLPQVFVTSGIRAAGILLVVAAALSGFDAPSDSQAAVDRAIAVAAGAWIGASAYDIATARAAARRYNRRHGLGVRF